MRNASKALDFSSFINEAKENGKVEILILSGNEKPSPTSKSFIEECEKQGIVCNSVNVNNIKLEKDRKSTRLNSSHIPLSRMPSSA